MALNAQVALSEAGLTAISNAISAGTELTVTKAVLGDSFGYAPNSSMTDIQGSQVHIAESNIEQVIGSGNGLITYFNGVLNYQYIRGTSLKIEATISSSLIEIQDDGTGILSGSGGITGTINYTTGVWELTFPTPPDISTTLDATYDYGGALTLVNTGKSVLEVGCILGSKLGDFEFGEIGYFLNTGELLALLVLQDNNVEKVASDGSNTGNVLNIRARIDLTGTSSPIVPDTILATFNSIPVVATEAELPTVSEAPYTVYAIENYNSTSEFAIAFRDYSTSSWRYISGYSITASNVEVENMISSSGQTPTISDTYQLAKAAVTFGSAGNYYNASYSSSTYNLTPVAPRVSPNSYVDGMSAVFNSPFINTGSVSAKIGILDAKTITYNDFSTPLQGGEINNTVEIRYNSANDVWYLPVARISPYYNIPIEGLICSSDTDIDHDIKIEEGSCTSSDKSVLMRLASDIVKRIDSSQWEEGTGNGGMPSGIAIQPNTWYDLFLISDMYGIKVDAGFDTQGSSATNLLSDASSSGYVKYKKILSIKTDSSNNIIPFYQLNDANRTIMFNTRQENRTNTSVGTDTWTPLTVTAPPNSLVSMWINYTTTRSHLGYANEKYLRVGRVGYNSPILEATVKDYGGANRDSSDSSNDSGLVLVDNSSQVEYLEDAIDADGIWSKKYYTKGFILLGI